MENEKKSYMQKLADKIVEWDKKIDELKQHGDEAASVMKEDYAANQSRTKWRLILFAKTAQSGISSLSAGKYSGMANNNTSFSITTSPSANRPKMLCKKVKPDTTNWWIRLPAALLSIE